MCSAQKHKLLTIVVPITASSKHIMCFNTYKPDRLNWVKSIILQRNEIFSWSTFLIIRDKTFLYLPTIQSNSSGHNNHNSKYSYTENIDKLHKVK